MDSQKLPYEPPQIDELGDFEDETQAGAGIYVEGLYHYAHGK